MTEAHRRPGVLLAAWAILLPLIAALAGSRSPRDIHLNLGPGDGPYVTGFTPSYEIDDKVATHWTTYNASVDLPLKVTGGASTLAFRFARVFPQTAVVEVRVNGRTVDRFECRGGLIQERHVPVGSLAGPVRIEFLADSHERKNLGLKLDWVRLETSPGSRIALAGRVLFVPALLVGLFLVLHLLAGWSPRAAAAWTVPWSLASAAFLLLDPWLTHRLLRGLPVALVLFGSLGIWVGRALVRSGRASAEAVRLVTALALATFLLRGLAVSHPDFYYPDLRTHARLVEKVQEGGLDFLLSPSRYIWEHGVWRTEAYGRTYAFPYSAAFHVPFAILGLPYDDRLVAMKLTGAALSVVPLPLVWALARRLGVSTLGTVLLAFIPTYTSRLSFAFLPALLGHAMDMAFFYWLAGHLGRVRERRVWLVGAGWVAACQLAYVSGVVNISLFVALLALLALVLAEPPRGRTGALILAMGLAGSALSVLLYYRDFLGMVTDLAARAPGTASRYAVQSFWTVAYSRTRDFFDGVYPLLAAAGLVVLWRNGTGPVRERRWLTAAWLLTYAFLLLGRARVPDLFLHGHETLLLTPLVALAAGHALDGLAGTSRAGRWAAGGLAMALAIQGLAWQWAFLADQLGNAR